MDFSCYKILLSCWKRIDFAKTAGIFLLVLVLIFSFEKRVFASDVSLSLNGNQNHQVGDNFDVDVVLQTGGNSVCSVKAYLSFPANLLQVNSLNVGKLYTVEAVKQYSNQDGTISYVLGKTGCGSDDTVLYTVNFKAKTAGVGAIKFTNVNVYNVNDLGMPTPLSTSTTDFNFSNNSSASTNSSTTTNNQLPDNSGTIPTADTKPVTTSEADQTTPKTPDLKQIKYADNATLDATGKRSKGVIFSGTADSNAKITISIDNGPDNIAYSDKNGNWQFQFDDWLKDGMHLFSAKSSKNNLISNSLITPFFLDSQAKQDIAIGKNLPSNSYIQTGNEVEHQSNFEYVWVIIVAILVATIVVMAYFLLRKKKKNIN